MAFPPQFLEELRARLSLSDVVGRRLRLIRAGREFKAPCPFHNEKTPSFYVNDQKGFFHCFGCGAHGDIVGFVMRHDNLSFPEAVEQLAALAGLPVPRASEEDRERHEKAKTLHDMVERACRWFEMQLSRPQGRLARDYLLGRGLDEETIARFRLGYAPADSGALRLHLLEGGFGDDDMVTAGLLRRPEDGRAPYAFFRHRVLFPVADRRGRVVAFGGRILEGDGPKYINTGETPLFHKGALLYGLSRARQAAADGAPIIVAEGYMDVISLVSAGFTGAVAPLGTALTETQIQELWKLIPGAEKEPVLCFDGDNAGRRAAWRAVERILPHLGPGQSARVAFLPESEDPDSLIRAAGAKGFQAVLDDAIPFAEALWRMETTDKRTDSPESKAAVKTALEARVETIADTTVRAYYRTEMRRRLDEAFAPPPRERSPAGLRPAWTSGRNAAVVPQRHVPGTPGRRTAPPPGHRPAPPARLVQAQAHEKLLLAAIINHPEVFDEVGEALGLLPFPPGPLEDLRQAVLSRVGGGFVGDSGLDGETLRRHLCSCGLETHLTAIMDDATFVRGGFARSEASIVEVRSGWWHTWEILRGKHVKAQLKEAEQALKRDPSDANLARVVALQQEIVNIGQAEADDDGPTFG